MIAQTLCAPPAHRDVVARVEAGMSAAFGRLAVPGAPPRLVDAIRYALFPSGGRLRPQLCVVASLATAGTETGAADAAAAAVELLHCASLVHDDLPCFDDADTRRGKPSVHKAFGESTALLVGDALIVHAFAEVARGPRAGVLVAMLAQAAGAARGIIAGQAWESEPSVALDAYHRAKTASLFEVAAAMGAVTSGVDPEPWRAFGEAVGRVYQTADDIADVVADRTTLGKPTGKDEENDRPSVVRVRGLDGARSLAHAQLRDVLAAVPECPGQPVVRAWVERFAERAGL